MELVNGQYDRWSQALGLDVPGPFSADSRALADALLLLSGDDHNNDDMVLVGGASSDDERKVSSVPSRKALRRRDQRVWRRTAITHYIRAAHIAPGCIVTYSGKPAVVLELLPSGNVSLERLGSQLGRRHVPVLLQNTHAGQKAFRALIGRMRYVPRQGFVHAQTVRYRGMSVLLSSVLRPLRKHIRRTLAPRHRYTHHRFGQFWRREMVMRIIAVWSARECRKEEARLIPHTHARIPTLVREAFCPVCGHTFTDRSKLHLRRRCGDCVRKKRKIPTERSFCIDCGATVRLKKENGHRSSWKCSRHPRRR